MDSVVFCCQSCRCRLNISYLEPSTSTEDKVQQGGNGSESKQEHALGTTGGTPSIGGLQVEESFVLLEHKKGQKISVSGGGALRMLEDSFVVLGPASMMRQQGGTGMGSSAGANLDSKVAWFRHCCVRFCSLDFTQWLWKEDVLDAMPNGFCDEVERFKLLWMLCIRACSLISKVNYMQVRELAKIFELASEETGVDHPLCVDCASKLRKELESLIRDIESEIAEYSSALEHLENGDDNAAVAAELQKEIDQVLLFHLFPQTMNSQMSNK